MPWTTISRPHRRTTYVDAAYCYRPIRVVGRSVTLLSLAKTAEPIEIPFGLKTRMRPGNRVLNGASCEGAIIMGKDMGRREHKFKRSRQLAPVCGYTDRKAHDHTD